VRALQAVFEGMFEDINNILNSFDVPALYGPEEMEQIHALCRRDCVTKRIPPTKINIFAQVGRTLSCGVRLPVTCRLNIRFACLTALSLCGGLCLLACSTSRAFVGTCTSWSACRRSATLSATASACSRRW
jgi:hypothetical protein